MAPQHQKHTAEEPMGVNDAAGEHKDHHKPTKQGEKHHHAPEHKHAFVHEVLKYMQSVKPPTNAVVTEDISKHLETLPADHPANLYRKGHGNLAGLFSSNDLDNLFKSKGGEITLANTEGDYQDAIGASVLDKSDIGMVKTINNNYQQHQESQKAAAKTAPAEEENIIEQEKAE